MADDKKKSTLGRGLDSIFAGGDLKDVVSQIQDNPEAAKSVSNEVELTKLVPNPYQPRKTFDEEELDGLAQSIKESGVFTPILVRENQAGDYYIVAGERRTRAARLAGLKTIPAVIADLTDDEMQRITLIENVQREDLNPIEVAKSLQTMIDDQKLKHDEAASVIGKSRTYVTNALGLLKLDERIVNAVLDDKISYGHARPLKTLPNDVAVDIFKKILDQNLSVREVEGYAKAAKLREARANKQPTKGESKPQEILYAEELVRNKLRTKVEINNNSIVIKFRGKDQLSRILERMEAIEK